MDRIQKNFGFGFMRLPMAGEEVDISQTTKMVDAFLEADAADLLRRLPPRLKAEHYHDDETHIRALLEESGLSPRGGTELAAATVRGLVLTVSHREQIGEQYPKVVETLVRGACRELFGEE